ncbi:MAG: hypothetical protein AUH29_15955 [Candidatus Rokubacteria bacterium 13_1_40CM_69_27]|nr:MAG: hypothetical protein AUH29_15955 [Candidatus Rokubacteria bacterium 13_1_40CM_69_27]OLE37266.1 MAG: hypothetical protein AUG00_08685 [Candidatus Rokubacteria bacterium 13_1_20CM_2_70_7]
MATEVGLAGEVVPSLATDAGLESQVAGVHTSRACGGVRHHRPGDVELTGEDEDLIQRLTPRPSPL